MTERAEAVLREALELPAEDRAGVAAELLASLDPPSTDDVATAQDLWVREIERRARRVLAGDTEGLEWSQVRDAAERQLAGE